MAKDMTKKEIVNLIALITFIGASKTAEQSFEILELNEHRVDKLMRILVGSFDNNEVKANQYVLREAERLIKKLDAYDDSKYQIKKFKREGI